MKCQCSYLARVLCFNGGVVDEFNQCRVAPAQRRAEVNDFLWWRWQSSEKQVIVEAAQVITVQSQSGCGLAFVQRLVLKSQRTLKKGHTYSYGNR